MEESKPTSRAVSKKIKEAREILSALGFRPKQSNELAALVLLAMLDLRPTSKWSAANNPLRGITPIIEFIAKNYSIRYAPNTRETIRDEAVKYFVEAGMILKNPDDPNRPTNSGNTVYQVEPTALSLVRTFGTIAWKKQLTTYLASRGELRREIERERRLSRIPTGCF